MSLAGMPDTCVSLGADFMVNCHTRVTIIHHEEGAKLRGVVLRNAICI